jgi:transmembrane carrier protein
MNRKGIVPRPYEIFAGASAGFLNVFLINPLEAIKIQIQVAGQMNPDSKLKSSTVIKTFGFSGLYRVIAVINYQMKESHNKVYLLL